MAVLLQSMDQVKRYDDPKLLNEYGDQFFLANNTSLASIAKSLNEACTRECIF